MSTCYYPDCSTCKFDKIDRGWFKRVHKAYKDLGISKEASSIDPYSIVLAYAITCGIGWIMAGVFAIIGGGMMSKAWGITSGTMFSIFYVIFIGLFGGAWSKVITYQKSCVDLVCDDYKKKIKRSSYEFLGYSISSFMLIIFAIIFTFASSCSLTSTPPSNTTAIPQRAVSRPTAKNKANMNNWIGAYMTKYIQRSQNPQTLQYNQDYSQNSQYQTEAPIQPVQYQDRAPRSRPTQTRGQYQQIGRAHV